MPCTLSLSSRCSAALAEPALPMLPLLDQPLFQLTTNRSRFGTPSTSWPPWRCLATKRSPPSTLPPSASTSVRWPPRRAPPGAGGTREAWTRIRALKLPQCPPWWETSQPAASSASQSGRPTARCPRTTAPPSAGSLAVSICAVCCLCCWMRGGLSAWQCRLTAASPLPPPVAAGCTLKPRLGGRSYVEIASSGEQGRGFMCGTTQPGQFCLCGAGPGGGQRMRGPFTAHSPGWHPLALFPTRRRPSVSG